MYCTHIFLNEDEYDNLKKIRTFKFYYWRQRLRCE